MRHLRSIVLATVAVALYAAPVAAAHHPVVTPAEGNLLGEVWAQLYSLPLSINPLVGKGDPCLAVGRRVVHPVDNASCTVTQGTAIMLGYGSAWSNVEAPYPKTEAEQRAFVRDIDRQHLTDLFVSVDGGAPIDIGRRRFELVSRQRALLLPEDNILDVPEEGIDVHAGTITMTAHGWIVLIRNLSPGRHTIDSGAKWDGEPFGNRREITVRP